MKNISENLQKNKKTIIIQTYDKKYFQKSKDEIQAKKIKIISKIL